MSIDDRLDSVLLRWNEEFEQGHDWPVDELCRECPELTEVAEREIAKLKAMHWLLAPPAPPQDSTPLLVTEGLRYRPVRFHARGGLGEVYLAHDREVGRDVALKLIQARLAGQDDSRTRFLREAEITGRLEHPGIVPIYGIGEDAGKQPFYAMRFIRGESLREALAAFHAADKPGRDADERQRSLRGLIMHLIAVCNAVAYAHSRGIIHRDIKPANVMLGSFGETLLVDWGLARPFERTPQQRAAGEETLPPSSAASDSGTQLGSTAGTPAYMSPEQASGLWDQVGPASDIFSLGASLYQIVTGKPPYDGQQALEDARRHRFAAPGATGTKVPRALEAIYLKAMAREPEQRYGSAKEMAADLERWLADERVSAYRETVWESLGRWVRRHRTLVTSSLAVLLVAVLLLGGATVVLTEANENERAAKIEATTQREVALQAAQEAREAQTKEAAQRQAAEKAEQAERKAAEEAKTAQKRAETVKELLVAALRSPDPAIKGSELKVVDLLDAAVIKIQEEHQDDPVLLVELLNEIGLTYLGIGEPKKAIAALEKARDLAEKKLGPEHPATLTSLNTLAGAYQADGQLQKALPLLEETLAKRKRLLGADHRATLVSMGNLANAYRMDGQLKKALPLLEETLEKRKAKLGADHPDTLRSLNNLAVGYHVAGQLQKALPLYEEALARRQVQLGLDHPDTLTTMSNLAGAYQAAGQLHKALPLFEEVLVKTKAKLGADHPGTLTTMNNLASAYWAAGQRHKALSLLEETLAKRKAKLGPDHPDTLQSMNNLAQAYLDDGQLHQALPLLEQTLAKRQLERGPDHPDTLTTMSNLAGAYQAAGQLHKALPLFEEVLVKTKAKLGADHPDALTRMNNLACAYQADGQLKKALPLYEETLAKRELLLGADHAHTLVSLNNLAEAYFCACRLGDAEALLAEWIGRQRSRLPADHLQLAFYLQLAFNLQRLGECRVLQHKCAEAEQPLRESLDIYTRKQPAGILRYDTESLLGAALAGQRRFAHAEALVLAGYRGLKTMEPSLAPGQKTLLRAALNRVIELYHAWGKNDEAAMWRAIRDGKAPG
jgi:serine/threonine protein kinase